MTPLLENNAYLEKFSLAPPAIAETPREDLGVVVVMPCHDEPDVSGSLDALWSCDPPERSAEVIVVLNHSEDDPDSVRTNNLQSQEEVEAWRRRNAAEGIRLHVLPSFDQPRKRAGVGLSRKVGMDEAVRRFDRTSIGDRGVNACFDADCACDRDYLVELERHFDRHPETPGCSVYFEHPLDEATLPGQRAAIVAYELHLRCYINGLRFAGFPGAFQTVGSSMAVLSWAYQKQGGMNCRQAGEDFYFLHRVIELGGFTELNSTRVIPSPRPSHRVPFGTGRAVQEHLLRSDRAGSTYALQSYVDLKEFLALGPKLREAAAGGADRALMELSPPLRSYLEGQGFGRELEKMRRETRGEDAFRRRFFGWFHAFRVMKSLHHCRDRAYGEGDLQETAMETLRLRGRECGSSDAPGLEELLSAFRKMDRAGWNAPRG